MMMKCALALAAAAMLAGCPGGGPEDSSQNAPPKTSTTTVSPRTPAGPSGIPSAPPVVDVQLLEYEIRVADTLPAGPTRFRIANAGQAAHSFAIEGPGLSAQLSSELTRGDKTELAVTLRPGTYTVWCPVDGHRGRGMERRVRVK